MHLTRQSFRSHKGRPYCPRRDFHLIAFEARMTILYHNKTVMSIPWGHILYKIERLADNQRADGKATD